MSAVPIQVREKEIRVGDVIIFQDDMQMSYGGSLWVTRNLKSCPFCFCGATVQSSKRQGTTMHQAYCNVCSANKGWHNTIVETIDRWNKREAL